ncbi:hypothetical protein R1sor_026890 [Riccia sorocarpa]|uniref:F-box domain-containing protein n=1 Tax=Riccia sorocarpa TaxID=122646 RepID=A0ABD3GFJ9_9MARC
MEELKLVDHKERKRYMMVDERQPRKTGSSDMAVVDERSRGSRVEVLDDDVVELIVQKIPFPLVYKACRLSKEWNVKFPAVLKNVCHEWPTYCPSFLSRKGELIGFDRSDGAWHRLRFDVIEKLKVDNAIGLGGPAPAWALDGVLLCTLHETEDGKEATVVNLLSGRQRVIQCPELEGQCIPVISSLGMEDYQIVLLLLEVVEEDFEPLLRASMFDSRSNSWVSNFFDLPRSPGRLMRNVVPRILAGDGVSFTCTYLDGDLYWCYRRKKHRTFCVVRTSLEDGSEEHTPPVTLATQYKGMSESFTCDLLRSGPRIIMVVSFRYNESHVWRVGASIYELDKDTFKLVELTRSPTTLWPDHVKLRTASILTEFHSALELKTAADDEYIYLCDEHLSAYHLETDTWSRHGSLPAAVHKQCDNEKLCEIKSIKFQASLNPFAVP